MTKENKQIMQFLFAADRTNPQVAQRYDCLSSVFLSILQKIIAQAKAYNVPVTLCGEMAGNPLECMALLGLGLRSISMAPASIGPIKSMILSLNIAHLTQFMDECLAIRSGSLRSDLESYAAKNQINVDPFSLQP